jgi:hypothetical protein
MAAAARNPHAIMFTIQQYRTYKRIRNLLTGNVPPPPQHPHSPTWQATPIPAAPAPIPPPACACTTEAATAILRDRAGRDPGLGERADAAELAKRLGGLPLALKIAGSYLAESTAYQKRSRRSQPNSATVRPPLEVSRIGRTGGDTLVDLPGPLARRKFANCSRAALVRLSGLVRADAGYVCQRRLNFGSGTFSVAYSAGVGSACGRRRSGA